jgi:choline dehydrogenase-like flavoprotein
VPLAVPASDYLQRIRLSSRGEVLLAAGALNTPKLLTLSGVADRNVLKRLNIPVVAHSPGVGANLQDHPMVGVQWLLRAGSGVQSGVESGVQSGVESGVDGAKSTGQADSEVGGGESGIRGGGFTTQKGVLPSPPYSQAWLREQLEVYLGKEEATARTNLHPNLTLTSAYVPTHAPTSAPTADPQDVIQSYGLFGSSGLAAGAFLRLPGDPPGLPSIQVGRLSVDGVSVGGLSVGGVSVGEQYTSPITHSSLTHYQCST